MHGREILVGSRSVQFLVQEFCPIKLLYFINTYLLVQMKVIVDAKNIRCSDKVVKGIQTKIIQSSAFNLLIIIRYWLALVQQLD